MPESKNRMMMEEDEPAGAPDWMVTFSDCMTLLLTFFVLLLSFSSFNPNTLGSLASSFAKAMPSVGLSFTTEQDSVWKNNESKQLEKIEKGSETKTLAEQITSNFMHEKKPLDFKNLKVFTIPSSRVFLGNGSVLSQEGRDMCKSFARFMAKVPSRVVVSENGSGYNKDIGLTRALAIMECITSDTGISKTRFNVTSASLLREPPKDERYVEFTVLDPSVYE